MGYMVSIKETNRLSIDKCVHDYLNPDYVYIPILEGDSLLVNENDQIDKEQPLIKRNNSFVYSTVSGRILEINENMHILNTPVRSLVIENDFKEHVKKRNGVVRYINECTKEQLFSLIKKYGDTIPLFDIPAKHLVVSGIDVDPFEKTNSFIVNVHSDKILETVDGLASILDINDAIISINTGDDKNVINLTNNIGTYPNLNLKLVSDSYPIGFKNILLKNILSEKQINEGVIYLTVEDVYNIYNILKRKKPITEKFVTLSGDVLSNPMVVNVKVGTIMADIIKNSCEVLNEKYYVVINGLIAGKTLKSLDTVLTNDIRSIFLNTRDTSSEKNCINCGLCNKKCPMGLNPKYIKDHKNADRSKCIGCGLCSYVCPSKINFKPFVGGRYEE